MFVIGKASGKEIEDMKAWGWDVEEVDVNHFDKALDPTITEEDPNRYEEHGDKLVSIFVDSNMHSLFENFHNEGLHI